MADAPPNTTEALAMLDLEPERFEELDAQLVIDANSALKRGALFAIGMGVLGSAGIPLVILAGGQGLFLPWLFSVWGFCASVALFLTARARRVRGVVGYAVMVLWVSMPTLFFLVCELLQPHGAALFITGPFAWLYFLLLVVAGFALNSRLSYFSAVVAAAGYALCVYLGYPLLREISAPNPILQQDLRDPGIWMFRVAMLLFGGLTVGVLGGVARRFTLRVLVRQRERERVERLLGEYVSPEVAERLITDPRAHHGERKQVAVLFSDIRGFTTWGETADPAEVVRRLNEYFNAMGDAIARSGGVIDKYIGDAVMAVFGGLVPLENACASAVTAALEMRTRLAALNARWKAQGVTEFQTGIGIHFGEVVQGALGSDVRKDFTVIGDAVNTASRLEGLTKDFPFPVLISQTVHEHLPAQLQARCEDLGEVKVKGRKSGLGLYGVSEKPPTAA